MKTDLDLTPEDMDLPPELTVLLEGVPVMEEGDEPAPYPHDDEDAHEGQDDLEGLGGPGDAPKRSAEAIRNGRDWIAASIFVGVGYCLKIMRTLFGVGPLWPDAETAWEQNKHQHRTSDPMAIPWGVFVFWTNGRYGHIALSIGHGWCITTDYKRSGFLCIARIADLTPWCRGKLVGWSPEVNGVVVWKPKAKPRPKPEPWGDLDDRLAVVEAALKRAKRNKAPARRIAGLTKWRDAIKHRLATRKDRK